MTRHPRVTEFLGYSGHASGANERPQWGHFSATFIDEVQGRFETWLNQHDEAVIDERFPYVVVNSAGRMRARFEDEEHARDYSRTLVGGRVLPVAGYDRETDG